MTALDRIYEAAAEARAEGVRAPADRPSKRRAAEDGHLPIAVVRAKRIEFREAGEDGNSLDFEGFASVYDTGYEMWDLYGPYVEQVRSGAGAVTLARADLDVPLVLSHDSMRRIARTTNDSLTLTEETVDGISGLLVRAPGLDPNDADVAYIAPKLRAGLIDEMSFRFRITSGEWSPDWTEYHIKEYDIHRGDVAIVGYGANPHTSGALRGTQLEDMSERDLVNLENALFDARRRTDALTADDLAALVRMGR